MTASSRDPLVVMLAKRRDETLNAARRIAAGEDSFIDSECRLLNLLFAAERLETYRRLAEATSAPVEASRPVTAREK